MVFAGWAPDDHVAGTWVAYFSDLVRARPRDLEQIKTFYTACSWRLAQAMRASCSGTLALRHARTHAIGPNHPPRARSH